MTYSAAPSGIRSSTWVSTIGKHAPIVSTFSAPTSAVMTTDLGYIMYFYLPTPTVIRRFFWSNGATAATNTVQVGIYNSDLTSLLLGTATTAAGASALQFDNVTDTPIGAGHYWLALVVNGATTTIMRRTNAFNRGVGFYSMAAARPLPATLVPAGLTSGVLPVFGFTSIA